MATEVHEAVHVLQRAVVGGHLPGPGWEGLAQRWTASMLDDDGRYAGLRESHRAMVSAHAAALEEYRLAPTEQARTRVADAQAQVETAFVAYWSIPHEADARVVEARFAEVLAEAIGGPADGQAQGPATEARSVRNRRGRDDLNDPQENDTPESDSEERAAKRQRAGTETAGEDSSAGDIANQAALDALLVDLGLDLHRVAADGDSVYASILVLAGDYVARHVLRPDNPLAAGALEEWIDRRRYTFTGDVTPPPAAAVLGLRAWLAARLPADFHTANQDQDGLVEALAHELNLPVLLVQGNARLRELGPAAENLTGQLPLVRLGDHYHPGVWQQGPATVDWERRPATRNSAGESSSPVRRATAGEPVLIGGNLVAIEERPWVWSVGWVARPGERLGAEPDPDLTLDIAESAVGEAMVALIPSALTTPDDLVEAVSALRPRWPDGTTVVLAGNLLAAGSVSVAGRLARDLGITVIAPATQVRRRGRYLLSHTFGVSRSRTGWWLLRPGQSPQDLGPLWPRPVVREAVAAANDLRLPAGWAQYPVPSGLLLAHPYVAATYPSVADDEPAPALSDPTLSDLDNEAIEEGSLTVTVVSAPGFLVDAGQYLNQLNVAVGQSGQIRLRLLPTIAVSPNSVVGPLVATARLPIRLVRALLLDDPWPGRGVRGEAAHGSPTPVAYATEIRFLPPGSARRAAPQWSPFGVADQQIGWVHPVTGTGWVLEEGARGVWMFPPASVSAALVLYVWSLWREDGFADLVLGAPGEQIPEAVWTALDTILPELDRVTAYQLRLNTFDLSPAEQERLDGILLRLGRSSGNRQRRLGGWPATGPTAELAAMEDHHLGGGVVLRRHSAHAWEIATTNTRGHAPEWITQFDALAAQLSEQRRAILVRIANPVQSAQLSHVTRALAGLLSAAGPIVIDDRRRPWEPPDWADEFESTVAELARALTAHGQVVVATPAAVSEDPSGPYFSVDAAALDEWERAWWQFSPGAADPISLGPIWPLPPVQQNMGPLPATPAGWAMEPVPGGRMVVSDDPAQLPASLRERVFTAPIVGGVDRVTVIGTVQDDSSLAEYLAGVAEAVGGSDHLYVDYVPRPAVAPAAVRDLPQRLRLSELVVSNRDLIVRAAPGIGAVGYRGLERVPLSLATQVGLGPAAGARSDAVWWRIRGSGRPIGTSGWVARDLDNVRWAGPADVSQAAISAVNEMPWHPLFAELVLGAQGHRDLPHEVWQWLDTELEALDTVAQNARVSSFGLSERAETELDRMLTQWGAGEGITHRLELRAPDEPVQWWLRALSESPGWRIDSGRGVVVEGGVLSRSSLPRWLRPGFVAGRGVPTAVASLIQLARSRYALVGSGAVVEQMPTWLVSTTETNPVELASQHGFRVQFIRRYGRRAPFVYQLDRVSGSAHGPIFLLLGMVDAAGNARVEPLFIVADEVAMALGHRPADPSPTAGTAVATSYGWHWYRGAPRPELAVVADHARRRMVVELGAETFADDVHGALDHLDEVLERAVLSADRRRIRGTVLDLRPAIALTVEQLRWVISQRESRNQLGPVEVPVGGQFRPSSLFVPSPDGAGFNESYVAPVGADGQIAFPPLVRGWRFFPRFGREGPLSRPNLFGPHNLVKVRGGNETHDNTATIRVEGVFRLWQARAHAQEWVLASAWSRGGLPPWLWLRQRSSRGLPDVPFPEAIAAGSGLIVVGEPGVAAPGHLLDALFNMITADVGADAFVPGEGGRAPALHLVVHGRHGMWPPGMNVLAQGLPENVVWRFAAATPVMVAARWLQVSRVLAEVASMADSASDPHGTVSRWRAGAAASAGFADGRRSAQLQHQANELADRLRQVLRLGEALASWHNEHIGRESNDALVPAAEVIPGLYRALAGYAAAGDWIEAALVEALPPSARIPDMHPPDTGTIPLRYWMLGAAPMDVDASRADGVAMDELFLSQSAELERGPQSEEPGPSSFPARIQSARDDGRSDEDLGNRLAVVWTRVSERLPQHRSVGLRLSQGNSGFDTATSTIVLNPASVREWTDDELFNYLVLTLLRVGVPRSAQAHTPDGPSDAGATPPHAGDPVAPNDDMAIADRVDNAVRTPVLGPVAGADSDADGIDGFALSGVGSDVAAVVGPSLAQLWEQVLADAVGVAVAGLGRLGAGSAESHVLVEVAAVVDAVLAGFGLAAVPVEWAVGDAVEELRSRAEFDSAANVIRLGRNGDAVRLMASAVHEAVHVVQHAVVAGRVVGSEWLELARRWAASMTGDGAGEAERVRQRHRLAVGDHAAAAEYPRSHPEDLLASAQGVEDAFVAYWNIPHERDARVVEARFAGLLTGAVLSEDVRARVEQVQQRPLDVFNGGGAHMTLREAYKSDFGTEISDDPQRRPDSAEPTGRVSSSTVAFPEPGVDLWQRYEDALAGLLVAVEVGWDFGDQRTALEGRYVEWMNAMEAAREVGVLDAEPGQFDADGARGLVRGLTDLSASRRAFLDALDAAEMLPGGGPGSLAGVIGPPTNLTRTHAPRTLGMGTVVEVGDELVSAARGRVRAVLGALSVAEESALVERLTAKTVLSLGGELLSDWTELQIGDRAVELRFSIVGSTPTKARVVGLQDSIDAVRSAGVARTSEKSMTPGIGGYGESSQPLWRTEGSDSWLNVFPRGPAITVGDGAQGTDVTTWGAATRSVKGSKYLAVDYVVAVRPEVRLPDVVDLPSLGGARRLDDSTSAMGGGQNQVDQGRGGVWPGHSRRTDQCGPAGGGRRADFGVWHASGTRPRSWTSTAASR